MRRAGHVQRILVAAAILLVVASWGATAAQLKMQQMEQHTHVDKDGDGKADEHDTNFDHEMFLGKEGAQEFSGLRAEEAKKKLGELFDAKIDANKDGKASREELTNWMQRVSEEHLNSEIDEQWSKFNKTSDSQLLTWGEYAVSKLPDGASGDIEAYWRSVAKVLQASDPAAIAKAGTVAGLPQPPKADATDEDEVKAAQSAVVADLVRDSRRWLAADGNKDGRLSKAELRQFLYPDDFPHMRALLVDEAMEQADKNRDGRISADEFLADMWNPSKESDEKEPDWVAEERKSFAEVKDKNKDGFLDRKEFEDYMFSHEQDKAELYKRETDHLISEADKDKDGALSRQEIVDNLELFAGSAATNFGDHIGLREDL